jgi:hypothetical protein
MTRTLVAFSLGLALCVASPATAADTKFSQAQIEEMVAPIALYPDDVLSQMLIASTYPLEIVEADRWRDKNPTLQGEALDKALAQFDWDPSVKSLTAFPDVLDRMSNNLDWTKDLGDAFLEQRDEVMDAAQRLRTKAYDAGTLKSTPQQTVVRQPQGGSEVVSIQPTDPQVVYVPTYQPAAVYGPTYAPPPQPYYPSFWTSPAGVVTTGIIGFGAGVATGALIGSAFNWGGHDVYVHNYGGGGYYGSGHWNGNVNRNVSVNKNVNVNSGNYQKWQHNGAHRRGVGYRDDATAKRYGGRDQLAAKNRPDRQAARGFEPGAGNRPGAGGKGPGNGPGGGQGLGNRAGGGQGPGNRPGGGQGPGNGPGGGKGPGNRPGGGQGGGKGPGGNQGLANRGQGGGQRPNAGAGPKGAARPAARPASAPRATGKGKNAFGDVAHGPSARQASQRGAASRGAPSRAGSPAFGGGGGHGGAPRGGFGGGGGHGGGHGGFGGGGGRGGGGGGRGGGGRRRH